MFQRAIQHFVMFLSKTQYANIIQHIYDLQIFGVVIMNIISFNYQHTYEQVFQQAENTYSYC